MKNSERSFLARYVYPPLAAFLLSGGGLLYFNSRFGMQMNDWVLLFCLAAFLALIPVFDRFKKHAAVLITGILLSAGLAAGIGLAAFLPSAGGTVVDWWLLYNPVSGGGYDFGYAILTVSIYIFLAGFLSYFLQKFFPLRLFCGVGVIAALVWLSVSGEDAHFFALVFLTAYLISVLAELCFCTSKRRRQQISSAVIALCLLPVSLLTSFVTVSIPRNEEPINWSFLIEAFDTVQGWFASVFDALGLQGGGSDEFSLSILGYSETGGKLGGDVSIKSGQVLEVAFPDGKPRSGLYLTGSTQDTYTGRGWEKNAVNFVSPYFENELDSIELLYAMERSRLALNRSFTDLVEIKPMTITYRDITTRSAFLPPKTLSTNTNIDEKNFFFHITSSGAVFDRPQRSAVYGTTFLDVNYKDSDIQAMIAAESDYRYLDDRPFQADFSNWYLSSSLDTSSLFVATDFEEVLKNRSDWIQDNYTALPDSLPQRVRDLTLEITQGYANDYDKLKAIERYLSGNYKYTLTPGEVPEDQDFVDYFLFENKEGYCTYFATAMAVMARSIGIPTRYVQGFCARCDQWIPKTNAYYVQKEEGHAWPEAYLEGVGWVPFEPTASRQSQRYAEWEDTPAGELETPDVPLETPDDGADIPLPDPGASDAEEDGFVLTGDHIALIAAGAVLLILLSSILFCALKIQKYRKKYLRADNAGKAYLDFKEILLLLERCGLRMDSGETLAGYSRRIGHIYRTRTASLDEAVEVYIRLYYKGEAPSEEELKKIRGMRDHLVTVVRARIGRIRFFLFALRMESENRSGHGFGEKSPAAHGRARFRKPRKGKVK